MDETKRYPTVQQAHEVAQGLLRERGWVYEPHGHIGEWVDPSDERAYVMTFLPVGDTDDDGRIQSVQLLQRRRPDDTYTGFRFHMLLDFT